MSFEFREWPLQVKRRKAKAAAVRRDPRPLTADLPGPHTPFASEARAVAPCGDGCYRKTPTCQE